MADLGTVGTDATPDGTTSYVPGVTSVLGGLNYTAVDAEPLPYSTAITGRPKVYLAGAWTKKPAKVYLAGAWTEKPAKRFNGTTWVAV